jgi:hypothetical protein
MKATTTHLFSKPQARIAIAGAGGAAAGAVYSWVFNAEWYVLLVVAGFSMLAQWMELRWTHYRMRLLRARRRARIAQLKRQA